MCFAVTVTCSLALQALQHDTGGPCQQLPVGATARVYGATPGLLSLASLVSTLNGVDLVTCTTDRCNNPTTDPCALPSTTTLYGSIMCGAFPTAVPRPSTFDIPCLVSAADGGVALQQTATPDNRYCVSITYSCSATEVSAGAPQCSGRTAGKPFRTYSAAAPTFPITAVAAMSGFYWPTSNPLLGQYHEVLLCSTPGCNSAASDTCALATTPVFAAVQLTGLPAAAFASDGTMTAAGVGVIAASLQASMAATGCATCTATISLITDAATGSVLYTRASARRLAPAGGVTVQFALSGASALVLQGAAAKATSASFLDALTTSLAAEPGYSGVSVLAATLSPSATPTPGGGGGANTGLVIGLSVGFGGVFLLAVAGGAAYTVLRARAERGRAAVAPAPTAPEGAATPAAAASAVSKAPIPRFE